jgi:hypothetical protein
MVPDSCHSFGEQLPFMPDLAVGRASRSMFGILFRAWRASGEAAVGA